MKRLALALTLFAVACGAPQRRATPPAAAAVAVNELRLGLRHYAAGGDRVLIVGAPGTTAELFDAPGYGGLAPYLQRRGYDVWLIDWRDAPLIADLDTLAAALRATAAQLAADGKPTRLFAHGLGGVVAVLAAPAVERYVFVAVPATLKHPLDPIAAFAKTVATREASLAELAAAFSGTQDRKLLDDLLWTYGAAPLGERARLRMLAPVGAALMNDLAAAIRQGGWGERFDTNLRGLTAPAAIFVAQTDAMAPPWQTYETYKRTGATTKFYRFFSRANGERREYGHLSVLVGDDAVTELFPFYEEALGQ